WKAGEAVSSWMILAGICGLMILRKMLSLSIGAPTTGGIVFQFSEQATERRDALASRTRRGRLRSESRAAGVVVDGVSRPRQGAEVSLAGVVRGRAEARRRGRRPGDDRRLKEGEHG